MHQDIAKANDTVIAGYAFKGLRLITFNSHHGFANGHELSLNSSFY